MLPRARAVVLVLVPACFHPNYDNVRCSPGGECPSDMMCNMTSSFCEGPGGGVVGGDAGVDAAGTSTDAPPAGNGVCYGPSAWQVCLDAKATGQVQLSETLDTDKSALCLATLPTSWTATQPAACIIIGDTLSVNSTSSTSVTGSRPLVLVAQSQITVTTLLNVSSYRTTGTGAGTGSSADCKPFGSNPGNGPGGGGAGGSFMFAGGNGGTGDGTNQPGGRAATGLVSAPTRLRGGCAGQPGGGGKATDGGAGGGAVYLVSAGTISVSGIIDASGSGGAGEDAQHGGGGGGSGGMIVIYAPSVVTTASTILMAIGGGGGGGSAQSGPAVRGKDGHEPGLATPIQPASGGTGGILVGSNGGDGGSGFPAPGNTLPGLNGLAGDVGAGGGGGGGGGGYIRSNKALGTAEVLPDPAIQP